MSKEQNVIEFYVLCNKLPLQILFLAYNMIKNSIKHDRVFLL